MRTPYTLLCVFALAAFAGVTATQLCATGYDGRVKAVVIRQMTNHYLQIADLQIFENGTNIAGSAECFQVPTRGVWYNGAPNGSSPNINDGDINTISHAGDPAMAGDFAYCLLPQPTEIERVVVSPRQDHFDRSTHFRVEFYRGITNETAPDMGLHRPVDILYYFDIVTGGEAWANFEATVHNLTCTDVDECATNACDATSMCHNTDGSFLCTCKEGFDNGNKTVYFVNFNGGEDLSAWSATPTETLGLHGGVLGRFDVNDPEVTLTLTDLDLHTELVLAFEFFRIDSWDNEDLRVFVDTQEVFRNSYHHSNLDTCYTMNVNNGNVFDSTWVDVVYSYRISMAHSAETATIRFVGGINQLVADESWALDNVMVIAHDADSDEYVGKFQILGSCETCFDGVQNQNENAVDAGGVCSMAAYERQHCYEVDECAQGRDTCHTNATCANTEGSFTCACISGYSGDGVVCADIDECTSGTHSCDVNAVCSNTPGSFSCSCKLGFSPGVSASCGVNDGAQVLGSDKCFFVPSTATATFNSAENTCNNLGGHLASIASARENEVVLQLYQSSGARAVVADGRMWIGLNDLGTENVWNWTDASPLIYQNWAEDQPNNYLGNQDCVHMWKDEGEWQDDDCSQTFPFMCATITEVSQCSDVDECATGQHNCDLNADCSNNMGSFTCMCNTGYEGNGTSCTDIDECASTSELEVSHACLDGGTGLFNAACSTAQSSTGSGGVSSRAFDRNSNGFYGNDGCTHTQEFGLQWWRADLHDHLPDNVVPERPRHISEVRIWNRNSNDCCEERLLGFKVWVSDTNSPSELDDVANLCYTHSGPVNTDDGTALMLPCGKAGRYVWISQDSGDPLTLCEVEIIDKQIPVDNCDVNAACANNDGSFSCACNAGWESSDGAVTCTDIIDCGSTDNCDANATCTDGHGSFTCSCDEPSFLDNGIGEQQGLGTSCDEDECVTGNNNCNANAQCSNTDGSFTCECNPGFESIDGGVTCVAGEDECIAGTDSCHPSATCTNTLGSFECACNEGYNGDGARVCIGNACDADFSQCHSSAYCEDTGKGGFCFCPEGMVGDGISGPYNGTGCSRESWSVRVTFDLGGMAVAPTLTDRGNRLAFWDRERAAVGDLFFAPQARRSLHAPKPVWFDTSMVHTVTDGRYVTVDALFLSNQDAQNGLYWFNNHTVSTQAYYVFSTGALPGLRVSAGVLTSNPSVTNYVSKTSQSEIRILPTGMDVLNVYYKHDCMASGCWVIDLIYTTGEDNFNVFYIPKAIGDDTLSFDFDYTAVPDYALPYGKSPADTFLPLNFPCGSDGYKYRAGPHIQDRVSACCIEEFTELYRPVDTFVSDPKVQMVLGESRNETCGGPELCAAEHGVCACNGTVQYGANGRFFYLESEGQLECSNAVFGDPIVNIEKTCSCSPRRPTWSKDYKPESALAGNFSGMHGMARVDFGSVLDPVARQFTATVYLDEVALRTKAGILSGAVGVAHSIDTFIGFANFKPTGLEFLDMFAAQTAIHLEKTNFFTVSAYGENQYTFLEYVNLRLVTVLDTMPEPFGNPDEYYLTAPLHPYPEYAGRGDVRLAKASQILITEDPNGGLSVHYYLNHPYAGFPNPLPAWANETTGFIAIHEGTTCDSHEAVGNHYFSTPTDPWTATTWTKNQGDLSIWSREEPAKVASTGFELQQNEGRVVVVTDDNGARIACGVLQASKAGHESRANSADYLQVTFTLGAQYQPIETGIIPLDSVLVSKGDFISSADTIETRFHACSEWDDSSFEQIDMFKERFPPPLGNPLDYGVTKCAPNATFCSNPKHIPDQFVHFNIPLGIDWLPEPSNNLDSNVFVDLVVSVIDTHQIAVQGANPNKGAPAEQMKTTLKASIPVVEGGVYIFCDAVERRVDLADVAKVDLIFGSASNEFEFSRLRIIKDLAALDADPNAAYIDTDSIEAGLMTLVIRGNESYFFQGGTLGHTVELEDLITIHVMEPETGSKYDAVLDLLFAPGREFTVAGEDAFPLNAAFSLTFDVAQGRVHLHPSDELQQICPFKPLRPHPDDAFPETCVSRRDVNARTFPALVGKNATAIELPAADVGLHDPERDGVASFMQLVLNPSQYSSDLGRNFSYVVAQKYALNGRYNRAFWINPGYEWSPQQTGRQTIFTLSQKIVLFALINLDLGFTRRRMLLQSVKESPTDGTGAGGAAQQVTFDTSPQSLMANFFNVPEELVATFEVELQLKDADVCLSEAELRQTLRTSLDEYAAASTTQHESVQILSMQVDKGDVQCSHRRSLGRNLRAVDPHATAKVEMLVVFSPSASAAIDLEHFASLEGVTAVRPLSMSERIQVTSIDRSAPPPPTAFTPNQPAPKDDEDKKPDTDAQDDDDQVVTEPKEPTQGSSSAGTDLVTITIGVAGGLMAIAAIAVGIRRYRSRDIAREVDVIEYIDVPSLKAELALP